MSNRPGRSGAAWLKARKAVLEHATHCAICGRPLVPDAPARSRWSSSVDHITPLSKGGHPHAIDGLRATHYGCNSRRGDGTKRKPEPARSRAW